MCGPWWCGVLFLAAGAVRAQQPDLSVVFVRDLDGNVMPGTDANPIAPQAWLSTSKVPVWTVQMHFTVGEDYPYAPHEIGTHKQWTLNADTVRDGRLRHLRFNIIDCWCRDQHLLVIQDGDTMRVDMPNDVDTREHLVHKSLARSGAVPTPEVVRFRPGQFKFVALAQDERMRAVELRIADRLAKHAGKAYMVRVASSSPMPAQALTPAPKVQRSQVIVPHGGSIRLVEQRGDTLVLRVTGAVMLDGGCASNTPMMAMQVNVAHDSWLQLASTMDAQMDCGLSTTEWRDHELRIPVVEWTQRHGAQGLAVMPGRYRLGVRFADGAVRWTKAFTLQ